MEKYMQKMTDDGLIRIIYITDDNLKKYKNLLKTTKRVVTITKRGLELLEKMEELPVIDIKKKAKLSENGFK